MKKSLFIIIILTVLIVFSYKYLKNSISDKKTYIFLNSSRPLIYRQKKLELESINEFEFEEYFKILSNNEYQYKYRFDDTDLIISLNNEKYVYPYTIKEKEKEIITEYVIQQVYVNNAATEQTGDDHTNSSTHSSEGMSQSYEYEDAYLNIENKILSFEKGIDLSIIINAIQASIDTNVRISVDYSTLNPNEEGEYVIFVLSELGNEEMIIKII